ncbi:MAG TPA: hypothetical protein VLC28_10115 [Flavitalea sp.]|nr:hypothetical protein [Flavitalea sp.]
MNSFRRTATIVLFILPSLLIAQSKVGDFYRFKDSSIHIEGIAPGIISGTFYFSGVNTGELYELRDAAIRKFPIPSYWPRWSMLGMKTDTIHQLLFISRSALPQSPDTIDSYHASDVIVFDLRANAFTKRFPMGDHNGLVLFNDIAITPDGRVLVSDGGRPGGVYALNVDEGNFRSLNTKGIKSPQGIVALDTVIYIASYTEGLFRYSIARDTSVFVDVTNLSDE